MDRLAKALYSRLTNYNDIKIDASSPLYKDVLLRGARLRGKIVLGEGVKVLGGVYLRGTITVGRYTTINGPNTDLFSLLNPITIGSFCSVARNVSIQEYNHDYDRLTSYYFKKNLLGQTEADDVVSKGGIEIGHDVWIGTHSVILSGVKIGNGAVIAANSVVTEDVPGYAIVGGTPAKVLKYRFDQPTRDLLEASQWWNLPKNDIVEYFYSFNSTLKR